MRQFIFLFLLFFTLAAAQAESVNGFQFENTQDANRFSTLIQEVRCVVCRSQSIADSAAPLAKDLQTKIYQLVMGEMQYSLKDHFLAERIIKESRPKLV